MRRIVIAMTVSIWPLVAARKATVEDLAGVGLELVEIADSGGYFVYSYELTNPPASTWGLSSVRLRIPASSGSPATLATTGDIVDNTASGGAVEPHAEVGPIAPDGWRAIITRRATVTWAVPGGIRRSFDSLAPGQTRDSLGLRSSYHPGITEVSAVPTVQSCCREPYDTTPNDERYYSPGSFRVFGAAVAPRYMPEEVDIDLLLNQLTAICDDPLWLDDSQLCTEFDDLLDEAADDYGDSNFYGALAVLSHLFDRIDEEQAAFDPNGYWLMRKNVPQAYENVQTIAESAAFLLHFHTTSDTVVVPDGRLMDWSPQTAGDVEGSIAASTSETFYWVRELDSGYTIADGTWAVQVDLFELELEGGDLSLRDIQIQRYSSSGTLLESKYLHQGEVMSLPTGEIRVPVAGTLTGWSAHSAGDLSVVSFTLQNDHGSQSASYALHAGVQYSDWGGSWLSQPK
jgi:hypothetical protein